MKRVQGLFLLAGIAACLVFSACQNIIVNAETVAPPQISNGRDDHRFLSDLNQTIQIASSSQSSSIYYTTNGDTPTSKETETCKLYNGPFSISDTTTVKAIAFKKGYADSEVTSETFYLAWKTMGAKLSVGRREHGSAFVGGKLYIMGGTGPETGPGSSDIDVYDPAADSISSFSEDTNDAGLAYEAIGPLIYRLGGTGGFIDHLDTENIGLGWVNDTDNCYGTNIDAANIDGSIYVFGCTDWKIEKFTPEHTVSDEPEQLHRTRLSAVSLGSKIYLFGGVDDTDASLADVSCYEPSASTKLSSSPPDFAVPTAGSAAVNFNGAIYVFGGFQHGNGLPDSVYDTTYRYDPATGFHADLPMPKALHSMAASTDGTYIYLSGGSGNSAYSGTPESSDAIYRFMP